MQIVIPSSAKFFPTKEFKTGNMVKIKKYVGHVDSKFGFSEDQIKKNPNLAGKPKKVNRFNVEYNGQEYQLDMNGASLKLIAESFGTDSEGWEGKEIVGEVLRMPNGGNMIEFKPVAWE